MDNNYKVQYEINGKQYQLDFWMSFIGGENLNIIILNQLKNKTAWKQIQKAHPHVSREDVSIINIEEVPPLQ